MIAAAVLVAASALAAAAPPTPAQLLQRHSPQLVLARGEAYRPTAVEPFLAASVERTDGATRFLDVEPCLAEQGPAATECYRALDGGPAVYGRAVRAGRRLALQYWLFYPYNPWSQAAGDGTAVWRSHEGDWEEVTVILDARTRRPLSARYSQHSGAERRPWRQVRRAGTHPLVYVGLGSHANYFRPGRHRHARSTWPPEAWLVFGALRLDPVDVAGGGTTLRPPVRPLVRPWVDYRGSWGERGFFHAGEVTLVYGYGPAGPRFHRSWSRPVSG